jgi:hypothetical protein
MYNSSKERNEIEKLFCAFLLKTLPEKNGMGAFVLFPFSMPWTPESNIAQRFAVMHAFFAGDCRRCSTSIELRDFL